MLHSVFHVETPEGFATAFPVGPDTLATNAHVAEMFEALKPGEKMVVRSPGAGGRVYTVTAVKIHPAYKAFNDFVGQDALRQRLFSLGLPGVSGYDVASLHVQGELPQDARLRLASRAELRALKPGSELATAGYPREGIAGSSGQPYRATPEYHTGKITSLTNFFDLPADFAHSQLIHDSVPAAVGASGSPIVDSGGRVVALLDAENSDAPGPLKAQVSTGAPINYAQRVDLLESLLGSKAEGGLVSDRSYWRKEFGVLSTGMAVADKIILGKLRDAANHQGVELVRVRETTGAFGEITRKKTVGGTFQREAEFSVPVVAGTDYVFIAYAHDGSDLQVWLYDGKNPLGHVPAFGTTFAPHIRYKSLVSGTLKVWLIHPRDANAIYTFQVFREEVKAANGKTEPQAVSG